MTKYVKIGACYSSGRQTVKTVSKNEGMPGYNCLTWVKSKQSWTAKTSYFDVQSDRWYEVYNSTLQPPPAFQGEG
jgi:hypothetical protein